MDEIFKSALNNPPHLLKQNALYMITGSIYHKKPLIRSDERKSKWQSTFLHAAAMYQWQVIAWVVLDNHYHAIVGSPEDPLNLSKFIGSYHKYTARLWNIQDNQPGRKVWWNYWDTCIRSDQDYQARLRYIFWNPIKHGFSKDPQDYQFSNYNNYLDELDGLDFQNNDEIIDVPEF